MENFTTNNHISPSAIEDKLIHGYTLDIGSYLSNAWNIFKKEWVTFSLYSFLFLLITMTGVGALFIFPLTIGFYLGADKVVKGEPLTLNDMFAGFSKNLGNLILLTLIPVVLLGLIYAIFFGLLFALGAMGSENDAMGAVAALVLILLYGVFFIAAIVLSLAMFFAPYLVYFGDYAVIDALKTSWKLSLKNILMIIVFSLLVGFITQIGVFACIIGIVASMGFAYVCYYPLMKDVLFDEKVIVNP